MVAKKDRKIIQKKDRDKKLDESLGTVVDDTKHIHHVSIENIPIKPKKTK